MLSSTPTQCCRAVRVARPRSLCVVAASAVERAPTSLQFVKGVVETAVPSVKLTRARDGSSGTAIFYFEQPDVFEASDVPGSGDITGLYLVDEEGTLSTVDVSAKFVNGKPKGIEAKYVMRSAFEWERFMRFMERYSEEAGMGFTGAAKQK